MPDPPAPACGSVIESAAVEVRFWRCCRCGAQFDSFQAATDCAARGVPPALLRGCIVSDYEHNGVLLLEVMWRPGEPSGHARWARYATYRDTVGPPIRPHRNGDSGPPGPERTPGPVPSAGRLRRPRVDHSSPRYRRAWAGFAAAGIPLTGFVDGQVVPAPPPEPAP